MRFVMLCPKKKQHLFLVLKEIHSGNDEKHRVDIFEGFITFYTLNKKAISNAKERLNWIMATAICKSQSAVTRTFRESTRQVIFAFVVTHVRHANLFPAAVDRPQRNSICQASNIARTCDLISPKAYCRRSIYSSENMSPLAASVILFIAGKIARLLYILQF